jgi:hypothetical protein
VGVNAWIASMGPCDFQAHLRLMSARNWALQPSPKLLMLTHRPHEGIFSQC